MKTAIFQAARLLESDRLDAKFYLSPGVISSNIIKDLKEKGIKCLPICGENGIAIVKPLLRFKSSYASENEPRIAYLRPYDVFLFLPTATHYLSIRRTKNIESYRLNPGLILQTCSGRNLGPLTMADQYLSLFVVSSDMLRIEVTDERMRFYILAYLNTEIGQTLLRRGKTGSVIDHLSSKHLESIEFPIFDDAIVNKIASLMNASFEIRQKARIELSNKINEYNNQYLCPEPIIVTNKGWGINFQDLNNRIDAAYYDPNVFNIRNQLLAMGGVRLSTVATIEKPKGRYKTVYVNEGHGLPILSGTQLLQEKPINLRYIAPRAFTKGIKPYKLKTRVIAYQADGRVEGGLGIPSMITSDRDGWLASGHIGRINANPDIHPGWLFLALSTQHVQAQIKAKASGSVVDSTFPEDMEDIVLPPFDKNTEFDSVCLLWEDFALAKRNEQQAINIFTEEMKKAAIR